ncbi:MAG TPA: SDR family NAD(P)-dependent oxidoreductase [Candidatus Sulfotelmatobacter sp.]|nr:SDR family NAD(P)-dependent oxidoreductase [Candidatus Sulfotelmatobacter sp.]
MENTSSRAIAIVGLGAVLPDAHNVSAFWENIKEGRYSIRDVDPSRWDPALYYDPDPAAPDKSYSKIGGWVREFTWEPMKWHLPLPPKVVDAMDGAQKWAIACTREALEDYGYPKRPLDADRTAVILGNAMAGEKHYLTSLRIYFPEYARELSEVSSFAALPETLRNEITSALHERIGKHLPEITEDCMPGELSNCIAGRIANLFNFHGPNYVCDAACASAMAAISSAVEGLVEKDFDAVITGGIDRNMGASTFVKFCKIGALSATGTRPYAEGADGFVMGEGAAIFLMKRLADAEKAGDKIYAVLRGMGGSSDGKGKGITAPNPIGQKFAIERAWQNAGLSPATATYVEGHGTSTRVGDVVEVESLANVLNTYHLPAHSVGLGSVKSNFGHLKGAAGAAGLLKTVLALHNKVLPPSVHCERPNPDIDFAHSPLYVNTELKPWDVAADTPRRAGLSAFGFGGTNFHAVLEEFIPGRLNGNGKKSVTVGDIPAKAAEPVVMAKQPPSAPASYKAPLRGALVIGASSESDLAERLRAVEKAAKSGIAPQPAAPAETDLRAPERIAIDYANAAELAEKAHSALKALKANQPAVWKALRAQGIFRGKGPAPKVAFLYPGQGSQYVNMLKTLRDSEPIVAETFAEADRVMTPLLGKPLRDFIFVDRADAEALAKAEDDLRQTAITQPAVLAVDLALTRLLAAYGIEPDFTMGHSLGEYGALVASGGLPFADALEAVSARGREMTNFAPADKGRMAAVFAPLEDIERMLKMVNGYVVIANVNSEHQSVIGGASKAVEQAMEMFQKAGYEVSALSVSHAFHTSIVAPASEPLRRVLERLHLQSPRIPIVANTDGKFYPSGPDAVPKMLDILAQQVASPVQFVTGLRTLYDAGARVFVEVGPKKALQGFAEDVLGPRGDIVWLFTNHPKVGDVPSFNQALCCLYAAGLGKGRADAKKAVLVSETSTPAQTAQSIPREVPVTHDSAVPSNVNGDHYNQLGRLFAEVLERGWQMTHRTSQLPTDPVAITGAAIGLPGTEHVFDDGNIARLLRGEQFIDTIPTRLRQAMLDKHITRLVKNDDGGGTFETITSVADVIKLAGRAGAFNLEEEFGVSADRRASLDRDTQLAMAVGLDALRDAGIPLVMHYKTTSKGTKLPDRWALPDALRDDTGVIFASAFPGYNAFADEMSRHYSDKARREQLGTLQQLRARVAEVNGYSIIAQEIDRRIEELCDVLEKQPYVFDRRYLFRVLSMGHSQFAEFIGARGPNTAINAACASTTQAVSLAEDWIGAGRCRRVVVVSADDITTDNLIDWMGAGFLASGAAATDEVLEDAAVPFDRRRHGMLIGMGAAGIVVESAEAARERGLQPICEVLSAVTANSAFHGTRLDVQHISQVMEGLIAKAEARGKIERHEIAPRTVFVSHETYTPARGGSAQAEIHALRKVFDKTADQIVIANTKGFTGHAMGAGIEDVLAVKALETGIVPPVANFKEVDPDLGTLNLSKGGMYPVEYALRLGAGFGSQISMTLLHWMPTKDGVHQSPNALGYAYRIADKQAWNSWLAKAAGHSVEALEVVHRTLRVPDRGPAARSLEPPAPLAVSTAVLPVPAVVVSPPQVVMAAAKVAPPAMGTIPISSATAERVTVSIPAKVEGQVKPPEPVVAPAALVSAKADDVKERVLTLVVEKTGYPKDMLDMDLDLEADLGIDTVKQAEMFAAIREIYNIPRDENRKLRDYPTLAHVVRFVHEKRPDLAAIAAPVATSASVPTAKVELITASLAHPSVPSVVNSSDVPVPAAKPAQPQTEESVKERVLALVVEKTGYPKDMLDLDLDLEADLGIDTVKQAEMFAAIREIYNIPRDENRKLRDYPTLARVIGFVLEKRPDLAAAANGPASPSAPSVKIEVAPPASLAASVSVPSVVNASSLATADSIKDRVLSIVAQKTGYPKDMLELDLDLEADLGIDTVKQAEMFAAIRAAYNIPRDENLRLRDFPTLAHVIKFAQDRSGAGAGAGKPSSVETKPGATKSASEPEPSAEAAANYAQVARLVPASLDAANAIPRRVPVPVLRPPLSMCKSTGAVLDRGRRVLLVSDKSGTAEALSELLNMKGVEVLRLDPCLTAEALADRVKALVVSGAIHGVYWLSALDQEAKITDLEAASWHEAVRIRVKSLYATMRVLYDQIAKAGTFLVAATRLGGQHGYDEVGAVAPLGGAVTGFLKTYKRERPEACVKAVDFEPGRNPADIARLLIEETLTDSGAVEIGYKDGLRWAVGLEEQSATDGRPGLKLDRNTVFVVTGAAGSIVSAITADLAAASGGTFYLLDLVPEPNANNLDLKRFDTDREALKRDLFARIQARGERATPALVEKELAGLERAKAALAAIAAVRTAGGTAHYSSVNLTDGEAVAKIVGQIRERHGRIDVLLHAAGLERSRPLSEKDPREFDLVFDVKADGFYNLLHAIGEMPLGATVAFSSIAGRFGNPGQTDYSSANDLLCKITSSFRTTRPATRGIAIDWTAWGEIGMASRGSIPKVMEAAGIDMLPPAAGIPIIRRELTAGGTRGEVVIGQRLGVLLNEWDETGGIDPAKVPQQGPMLGRITKAGLFSPVTIETTLDPKLQPFLYDHQIDGTPVLPGVMGIEAFAEAALAIVPGWHIEAIEDVNFLAPFKFYRNEPRTVTVEAIIRAERERVTAECKLIGHRSLPNQSEPQVTTHFTARVVLTKQPQEATNLSVPGKSVANIVTADEIYRLYFHGPAYQVVKQAWSDGDHVVGLMSNRLPANHRPDELPTQIAPRLIELCFQTAGIWEMGVQTRMGLPQHIDRVRYLGAREANGPQYAVVTPNPKRENFDIEVVDEQGRCFLELHGYRTITLPNAVDSDRMKALHAAVSPEPVAA